jgi:uncharacterized membrane protein YccC
MPALFAAALLGTHDVQLSTFAGFGTFALVVLADFGGPAPSRAGAYVVTALIGAVLIGLGTLAGAVPWVAALATLAVAFVVQFAGVYGGYAAASQVALQLAFVLAVSLPVQPGAIPARIEGWLLASVAATVAALVLWPQHERTAMRERAASACHALARLIEARLECMDEGAIRQREETARDTVVTLRSEYAATPFRPAGPTRPDRAFAQVLVGLDRGLRFAARWAHEPSGSEPSLGEEDVLERALIATLRGAGDALTGGPAPDLAALDRAKGRQREALERWAAGMLCEGAGAEDVLSGLRAGYRLRLLSYIVLALGASATIATGREPGNVVLPAGTPRLAGIQGAVRRVAKTIRTELAPGSTVLHNSLRGAAGLALAVLLARILGLHFAFWAVLGTLSVLRSNALATGRTTVQALAGTLAGFAVGAAFILLAGGDRTALWMALPVAVFLAAYTPTAVHFVVGQAAFTILVIVLFNLIAPGGWTVGLVRVEDIALGTAVSVVVGLLIWPRGARADLRRALAQLYRSVAGYVSVSLHRLLDGEAEVAATARAMAVRAGERAGEAFDLLMVERAAHKVSVEVPAFLVAAGSYAILVGDLVDVLVAHGYRAAACADETAALDHQARLMLDGFLRLADRLEQAARVPWWR